ncbi:strictosidine synthase family protein [Zavarzinia compransoris]|uniref:SMP-30/Gluconolactonase/LRE-like region domain-containing protein n=1 Tax=Zavarzinia compransoris TaxID=1264899 RepID=A0A317E3T6_9PROT|nr:SMP-30/gluconolactonase/LRE family protein [Zavarzinia compransoris]PWR21778.1 hypothetical protein DKG75_07250 [Zavarzinia compransoris]TDP45423.1 arylesterase/paraoxonase [Zavarzinia compransoris]
MAHWGKRLVITGAVVFVACAGAVGAAMYSANQFRSVEAAGNVACAAVTGVVGAEDIVVDLGRNRAFVSIDDRRAAMAGRPVRGRIAMIDLAAPSLAPVDITPAQPETFHPHGISLWTDPATGERSLFVVNHIQGGLNEIGISRVEIFGIAEDGRLTPRGGVIGAEMNSPNDVLAVGPNQFYASNDHGSTTGLGILLENYLQLPRATVVYYDGKGFTRVADGIRFANGLGLSPDGRQFYVAETTGFAVRTYDRNPDSGRLTLRASTPVDNGVDNIDMAPDGSLWIAGHPRLLDFVAHAGDAAKPAPSEVVRLSPGPGGLAVETVMTDPGQLISAASVAAYAGPGRFLVGAVFDEKLLDCRVK